MQNETAVSFVSHLETVFPPYTAHPLPLGQDGKGQVSQLTGPLAKARPICVKAT